MLPKSLYYMTAFDISTAGTNDCVSGQEIEWTQLERECSVNNETCKSAKGKNKDSYEEQWDDQAFLGWVGCDF